MERAATGRDAWRMASLVTALFLGTCLPHFAVEAALAETLNVVGQDGPEGQDGALGEPGLNGEAGEDVEAFADSEDDARNSATATGGSGGAGGVGGDGVGPPPVFFPTPNGKPGGDGGDGGRAEARATIPGAGSRPQASATARGGAGGHGGMAGRPSPEVEGFPLGTQGGGGAGGDAYAEILRGLSITSGSSHRAFAVGGDGGDGVEAGDGGEGRAVADIDDPDSTLISFSVDAEGGDGGDAAGSGTAGSGVLRPGNGGAAVADARATTGAGGAASIGAEATGGAGGRLAAGLVEKAGRGGSAEANANTLSGGGDLSARAVGGAGGVAEGEGRGGGDGGSAQVQVSTMPTALDSSVRGYSLEGNAFGGSGGDGILGATGGDGADVSLVDAVSGPQEANGVAVTLRQRAGGGQGGSANSGANGPLASGGAGGDAESRLAQSVSAQSLSLEVSAIGGQAGSSDGLTPAGMGGASIASASGGNATGSAFVEAFASGGAGSDNREVRAGSGGLGGDAAAIGVATSLADGEIAVAESRAEGGEGGDSSVSSAGAGADASADSTAIAIGDSRARSTAFALGGDAGEVEGRSFRSLAEGRSGGNADSRATASNSGSDSAVAEARSEGGDGSNAIGRTRRGGDGGQGFAEASGSSGSGSVSATAESFGGRGGDGESGADAGDGGDAIAVDAASGMSTGSVFLTQNANGGAGGDGPEQGGRGGNATSVLNGRNVLGGDLVVDASAVAGVGGDGAASNGDAGNVRLEATGVSRGDVTIRAEARLGQGSELELGPIHGDSTGGGDVEVSLEVDRRVSFARAGSEDPAQVESVSVNNGVTGETSGSLSLSQRVFGGSLGTTSDGRSGIGGDAESELSGFSTARETEVLVNAFGGSGADEDRFRPATSAGAGGDASATADYSAGEGRLRVDAGARGGDGGAFENAVPGGDGGSATVRTFGVATLAADQGLEVGTLSSSSGRIVGAFGGSGGGQGDGGVADSHSRGVTTISDSFSRTTVEAYAVGGVGGELGGQGGDASSLAEGTSFGRGRVIVEAEALGGAGLGGGEATASAAGQSLGGGSVDVSATQRAGSFAYGDLAEEGARAGTNSEMLDAVSGSTTGELSLIQSAIAGTGARRSEVDGSGGAGGRASSRLTRLNTGGGETRAEISARGGQGGEGRGAGQRGGQGGEATASAELLNLTQGVSLELLAEGGNGGWSSSNAESGDGGAAGFGNSRITAAQGAVDTLIDVSASARAGNGGNETRPLAAGNTLAGGNGGDVALLNAVELETQGIIRFQQEAVAGDGGFVSGLGQGGSGGDARSALDVESPAQRLTLVTRAQAGAGGDSLNGRAGASGEAIASIRARSAGDQTLSGTAVGGSNGLSGDGLRRDKAGDAEVSVEGIVDGDDHLLVIGNTAFERNFGANGGAGQRSSDLDFRDTPVRTLGDGGDARSQSLGRATGNSIVNVNDRAVGGLGSSASGSTFGNIAAGDGGLASSSAEGTGMGDREVRVTSTAIGGDGGFSSGNRSGSGGDAESTAIATGNGLERVSALSEATGGRAGFGGSDPESAVHGSARSDAVTFGLGLSIATARATTMMEPVGPQARFAAASASATSSRVAHAEANVSGSGFRQVGAWSELERSGELIASVSARVSGSGNGAGGSSSAFSSLFLASEASMAPLPSEEGSSVIGEIAEGMAADVLANFEIDLRSDALDDSGSTRGTIIALALTPSVLSGELALEFGEWSSEGDGISEVEIEIGVNGVATVERAFSDVALAVAFLTDARFDLGAAVEEVRAEIRFESADFADRLMGSFALLVVPEPGTGLLLGIGLVWLGQRRR